MGKHETLPPEYGVTIAEIEGQYYPIHVDKRDEQGMIEMMRLSSLYWETEASHGIPLAQGSQPTQGTISFRTHRATLDFCHRRRENHGLWYQWEKLATWTELYPERNAWYQEEILRLAGDIPTIEPAGSIVYGSVFRCGVHCFISTSTIDEAWERLYERVCEHVAQKQTA